MTESIVSANEFRRHLDMPPVKPAKHKLVVWPFGANPPPRYITFKCVKCSRGVINLGVEGVRGVVSGNQYWRNWLVEVPFGSWGRCAEDLDQPLERP